MARQPWFFNLDVRRTALPAAGDGLERLAAVVDFELFRAELDVGLDVRIAPRAAGRRTMRSLCSRSGTGTRSCASWAGVARSRAGQGESGLFREQLTEAGAIERLFDCFVAVLRAAGYLVMDGQIVDAHVVEARRQARADGSRLTSGKSSAT